MAGLGEVDEHDRMAFHHLTDKKIRRGAFQNPEQLTVPIDDSINKTMLIRRRFSTNLLKTS